MPVYTRARLHASECIVRHARFALRTPTRPGQGQACLFLWGFSVAWYVLRLKVLPHTVHAKLYDMPKPRWGVAAAVRAGLLAMCERGDAIPGDLEEGSSVEGVFKGPEAVSSTA